MGNSKLAVQVWLVSFIVSGLILEGDLLAHHALLISWYVATWFVAFPAFVFSVGVLMGHWAGQGFRVNRWLDLVVWVVVVLLVAAISTLTLSLFVAGVAAGHSFWQFKDNKIAVTEKG